MTSPRSLFVALVIALLPILVNSTPPLSCSSNNFRICAPIIHVVDAVNVLIADEIPDIHPIPVWMFNLIPVKYDICTKMLYTRMCQQVYNHCRNDTNPDALWCMNDCEMYSAYCAELFHGIGTTLPTPFSSQFLAITQPPSNCSSVLVSPTCTPWNANAALATVPYSCPAPLLITNSLVTGGRLAGTACDLPCLTFVVSDASWAAAETYSIFFVFLSMVSNLFILATLSMTANEQHYLLLFFKISSCIDIFIIFTIIVFGADGYRFHQCKNATEVFAQSDWNYSFRGFIVVIKSVLIQVLGIANMGNWFILCFNLWSGICMEHLQIADRYKLAYRSLCAFCLFVLPLYNFIMILALNAAGGSSGNVIAGIYTDSAPWVIWVVFYAPCLFLAFVGGFLMSHIFFVIYQTQRNLNIHANATYVRPIIFIVQQYFWLLLSSIPVGLLSFNSSDISDSSAIWIACLLFNGSRATCGDTPAVIINPGVWHCLQFLSAGSRLFSFANYGFNWKHVATWKAFLARRFNIHFDSKAVIMPNKTPSASSGQRSNKLSTSQEIQASSSPSLASVAQSSNVSSGSSVLMVPTTPTRSMI